MIKNNIMTQSKAESVRYFRRKGRSFSARQVVEGE
jgi:hypothetical protein